jgi:hypothetical protein
MRMTSKTEMPVRTGAQTAELFARGLAPRLTDTLRWANWSDEGTLTRYVRILAELSHVLLLIVIVVAHPIWVFFVFLLVFFWPTAAR